MIDEESLDEDSPPPDSKHAARRLLILKIVVMHAVTSPPRDMLKVWMQKWSTVDRESFTKEVQLKSQELAERLHQEDLWKYMSPSEHRFIQSNAVTMSNRDQIDFSWRMESIQVLIWALKMIDQMTPLNSFSLATNDLLRLVPVSDTASFIKDAGLRIFEEIESERDKVELWHWRSRTRQLIESGATINPDNEITRKLGHHSYDDIVRQTTKLAYDDGTIPLLIKEDFGVHGKAYRDLSDDEWSQLRSITQERHFALNWLCGLAPENEWDETPTDT